MEEKLVVELKNLISVFSSDAKKENFYQIPNYQRPYSWNKDNISQLLDDLFNAYESSRDEEYFCGSIVLVNNEKDKRSDIIDGQQRFTTFTIFFCVLKALYENELSNQHKDALNEAIHDRYNAAEYRLRFRTDDKNENDYEQSIVSESGIKFDSKIKQNQIEKKFENNKYLQNAYHLKYYFENLDSRPNNLDINDFIEFLMNNVVFAVIKSSSTDNAIRIFNVLNDRGLPLSPVDILKSSLMTSLDEESRKTFKADWDKVYEKIEQNFDFYDMLQSYLYYKLASNPKKRIDEELLEVYKKENDGKINALKAMNEISRFADCYLDVLSSGDKYIYSLEYLRHKIFWTTILTTAKFLDYESFDALEKYIVAYYYQNWIAGATLARIKQTSFNIISAIKNGKSISEIKDLMKKNLEKYETTQDFKSNLNSGNVYQYAWCKSVLFVCEYFSTDNDKVNFLPLDKSIWIEHVLPETPTDEWKKNFSDEQIEKLTHCIGNLTPLSLRKNVQAKNYSFTKKKETYSAKDNVATSFYITQQVLQNDSWLPKNIEDRQNEIIGKLCGLFDIF